MENFVDLGLIRDVFNGVQPLEALYVQDGSKMTFQNPLFNEAFLKITQQKVSTPTNMRLKDFLASIPIFSDFSDNQLLQLEQNATVNKFNSGDIVFKQYQQGDAFYVIHKGSVEVLIQSDKAAVKANDLGKVVNELREGSYFGDRALMNDEPRAASIRVSEDDTVCLVFARAVFEDIISGSNALIGSDANNVDYSKDNETRSLVKHVGQILEIENTTTYSVRVKRALYELTTAFTPELTTDEIMARMVLNVKQALKADRVGLFVVSEDKKHMILKVSERSKGVKLPIRGLAGAVITDNMSMNLADAYEDSRFDSTMDKRIGYRTRQVLGAPLRLPLTGEAIGCLQVNNRTDDNSKPFLPEAQKILELTALQLSELLHGRTDLFDDKDMSTVSSCAVDRPVKIEISNVAISSSTQEVIDREGITIIEVQVGIFLGLSSLCTAELASTTLAPPPKSRRNGSGKDNSNNDSKSGSQTHVEFGCRLEFEICIKDLPKAARILFRVGGKKKASSPFIPLGWTATTIFNYKGLVDGFIDLKLFPGDQESPVATTLSNAHDNNASSMFVVLLPDLMVNSDDSTTKNRVVHSIPTRVTPLTISADKISDDNAARLEEIKLISFSPLSMTLIVDTDKEFLWSQRYSILDKAEFLPAMVMSIPWHKSDTVQEFYDLLDLWKKPLPTQALQLLDRRFMDPKVRAYAVHSLEELPDDELVLFMLQLCQQLKFESFIDSALSRFLLRRALLNSRIIGHHFFWLLQSEIYNVDVKRRFSTLLQIYIKHCGSHRLALGHQMFVMKRLECVAELVTHGESKSSRLTILRDELKKVQFPPEFCLPLNPNLVIRGVDIERCRVMESKKKPLWLTFKDAPKGGNDLVLMLKVGDDLRQDALIMQLLRVMNDLWEKKGYSLEMKLYDCISTGFERGLLQVVLNSNTLANILLERTDKQSGTNKAGSIGRKLTSAMKALSDFTVFKDWIMEQVEKDMPDSEGYTEDNREDEYYKRRRSFLISTAAYCVASFVLGLGDRHNDNLMMTRNGHFFHIDFGHILGNFKSKMGIKRERALMVFTHAMKETIGDEDYEEFVALSCTIFNILRENATLLVSLFSLAVPMNLPELQREKDVMWIYEKLQVDLTEEKATEYFRKQLNVALHIRGTRINDMFHMLAHA